MTSRPRDHRTANVQPVQRELIFDIDMTDYDEVRTCCSGAEICQKCWKFMVVACQILDSALRGFLSALNLYIQSHCNFFISSSDDFNFENILWVFSGRRGIHCWVCDKTARYLSNKNRNAVAEYLNLFSSVQNSVSRVSLSGDRMHHSVKRAYQIVDSHFEDICLNDQNIFATEKGQKKLLELIPDENLRKDIEANIKATETNDSKVIWDIVTRLVNVNRNQNQMQRKMKFLIEEIQMSMLCPRLDISVSKVANHLLKAPFCVHPKTGKICVPFNAAAVSKFDPTTVPTIRQLLKEIDDYDKKNIDKTTEGDIAEKQSKILVSSSVNVFSVERFLITSFSCFNFRATRKRPC